MDAISAKLVQQCSSKGRYSTQYTKAIQCVGTTKWAGCETDVFRVTARMTNLKKHHQEVAVNGEQWQLLSGCLTCHLARLRAEDARMQTTHLPSLVSVDSARLQLKSVPRMESVGAPSYVALVGCLCH